jgi:hypothetical protein
MRLYLPRPIRDPLLGAVSRLETSFDVSLSLKRVKRYGWKCSRLLPLERCRRNVASGWINRSMPRSGACYTILAPLLGAVSRLETSFDVSLSLKRVKRYGWKWSRDWEYEYGELHGGVVMSAGSVLWSELEESRPTGHRHPEGGLGIRSQLDGEQSLRVPMTRRTRLLQLAPEYRASSLETAPSRGSRIGRGRYNRILYVVLVVLSSRPPALMSRSRSSGSSGTAGSGAGTGNTLSA